MYRRSTGLLAPVVLSFLVLFGCSERDGGADALTDAIDALTVDGLDVLVLPPGELGDLGQGLEIEADSGPVDNARWAENSLDPDDTEADVDASGRLGGYSLDYGNATPAEDDQVMLITSSVTLYEDAEQASDSLADGVQEFLDQQGNEVDGLTIEGVDEWDPADAGDERRGVRVEMSAPVLGTIHATAAYVRIDRLGFTVAVLTLDDSDLTPPVDELVTNHEAWIRGVLSGEIEATPVPIEPEDHTPEAEPEVASDETPATGPGDDQGAAGDIDLGELALAAGDLPEGFTMTGEGLDPEGSGELDYTRSYEAEQMTAPLGDSDVLSIENNIMVFASETEATAFATTIVTVLSGEQGEELIASFLEDEGLSGSEISTEVREFDLGDETSAVVADAQTSLADFLLTYMVTREGRVVSALIVVGDATAFDVTDVMPLAEVVHGRIAAAGIE